MSNETKWTSGPWSIHSKAQMSVMGAKGYAVAACGGYADNTRDCDELFAEQEANARLIAAAPDLYAALEKAREYVGPVIFSDGPRQDDCERCDALIDEIDAALRKARGEQ